MRKLIILCLLLYNFNSLAYSVVCVQPASSVSIVINDIRTYDLAIDAIKIIESKFKFHFFNCQIIRTIN